jgi:hypothetical protein
MGVDDGRMSVDLRKADLSVPRRSGPAEPLPPSRPAVAARRARDAGDRLMVVLRRLLPHVRRLDRGVLALAGTGAGAAVLIVTGVAAASPPASLVDVLAFAVLAAILLVPVGLLYLLHRGLAEVMALPDKLRSYPELARRHGPELVELVQVSRQRRRVRAAQAETGSVHLVLDDPDVLPTEIPEARRGGLGMIVKLLWQLWSNVPDKTALVPLISPPFLAAAGLSALAVLVEWILAVLVALAVIVVVAGQLA